MYKIPNCSYMITDLFWKRECFSDQTGNSLSDRVIEPLYITCFSALFRNGAMPFRRKYILICWPEIRAAHGKPAINSREWFPKPSATFSFPVSDITSGNFFCVGINYRPDPAIITLIPYGRPYSITLYSETAFSLGVTQLKFNLLILFRA